MPRRTALPLIALTLGFAAGLTGCSGEAKTPISPSTTPSSEGLGGTPTEVLPTATAAKTKTPTDKPLFTDAEVESANPFDDSTWPDRFKQTQEHPELATEQQWQDEYQFLLAVRENKGIAKTAEFKDHINPQLQSLWNAVKWMQEHPDEVKIGELKLILSPVEYRAMIEESRNIEGLLPLPPNDFQGWNSEYVGPILGRDDIDSQRHPFDSVIGELAGIGTIGEQNVILIDIRGTNGYHILFPAIVYIGDGPTLTKGSRCLTEDTSRDPVFVIPKDVKLPPLEVDGGAGFISWKDLYDGLGKIIRIFGGYGAEIRNIFGQSAKCFSPDLNLEMAHSAQITNQQGNFSPWTEK
jgi:hypothetical protein